MIRALLLVAVMFAIGACSAVPNLDRGSMGCQNARGIGPTGGSVPFAGLLIGKSPGEAAAVAIAQGHTVVFSVQTPGYGECWCATPLGGQVKEAWWGESGALWLLVEGFDPHHTPDNQPMSGWGC
jgi:hypothetical protein